MGLLACCCFNIYKQSQQYIVAFEIIARILIDTDAIFGAYINILHTNICIYTYMYFIRTYMYHLNMLWN